MALDPAAITGGEEGIYKAGQSKFISALADIRSAKAQLPGGQLQQLRSLSGNTLQNLNLIDLISVTSGLTNITSAIAKSFPVVPQALQLAGSIAGLSPVSLLQAFTAFETFNNVAVNNITLDPLKNDIKTVESITSRITGFTNVASLFDGTTYDTFLAQIATFDANKKPVLVEIEKALLNNSNKLDSTTENVVQLADSVKTMASIITANYNFMKRKTNGQTVIDFAITLSTVEKRIRRYSNSGADNVTTNYTSPINLHFSMAGLLSGTPLGGSGSLLGGIQGLTSPGTGTNISTEALVKMGFGNKDIWEKYDRSPSAVSDPLFWAGKRPYDNPKERAILTLADFLGSNLAKQEVQLRNNRSNFNVFSSIGLVNASNNPQAILGYLNTGFYSILDAFAMKGGGAGGSNLYGFNFQSMMAAASGTVVSLLNSLSSINTNSPGSQQSAITVGNLLNSPHLIADTNYRSEPDTNRLGRGVSYYPSTISNRIDSTVDTQITTATGKVIAMPTSKHGAQYPFNAVTSGQAGVIQEIDNTPGNPRYHIFHPSGTRIEIDKDGVLVTQVNSDSYIQIIGDQTVNVRGNYHLTVESAAEVLFKNKANIVVQGDANIEARNDLNIVSSGGLNINAKESIRMKAPNIDIQSNDMSINVARIYSEKMESRYSDSKNRNDKVAENHNEESTKRSITAKSMATKTSGETSIKGTNVHVNSGGENPNPVTTSDITDLKDIDSETFKDAGDIEKRANPSEIPRSLYPIAPDKAMRDSLDEQSPSANPSGSGSNVGGPSSDAGNEANENTGNLNPGQMPGGANPGNYKNVTIPSTTGVPNDGVLNIVDRAAGSMGCTFRVTPEGGKSGRSQGTQNHPTGNALDGYLDCGGGQATQAQKSQFISNAVQNGATGIGTYPEGFIHVDDYHTSLVVWGANGKSATAETWAKNAAYGASKKATSVGCEEFAKFKTGAEEGDKVYAYRLSNNFYVRHFTRDIAGGLGHYLAPASTQSGGSLYVGDILCNLKKVAENIAEPIYAKYAQDMVILSGYRTQSQVNNSYGAHVFGLAMDIQRKTLDKKNKEEYEKWFKEVQGVVKGATCELKNNDAGEYWIQCVLNSK